MAGREERVGRINRILAICRRNKWTYSTPNIAGKIEFMLGPAGFTTKTIRDYTRAIVDLLAMESRNRKPVRLKARSFRISHDPVEDAMVELVFRENAKKTNPGMKEPHIQ